MSESYQRSCSIYCMLHRAWQVPLVADGRVRLLSHFHVRRDFQYGLHKPSGPMRIWYGLIGEGTAQRYQLHRWAL